MSAETWMQCAMKRNNNNIGDCPLDAKIPQISTDELCQRKVKKRRRRRGRRKRNTSGPRHVRKHALTYIFTVDMRLFKAVYRNENR